jgi:predicted nucleic acid-binding protein
MAKGVRLSDGDQRKVLVMRNAEAILAVIRDDWRAGRPGNCQVRFGGRRMEKGAVGYPSHGHTNSDIRRYLASRLPYRELIRRGARTGLTRLDALTVDLAYAALTTPIMRKAAEFWADLRRRGLPTAGDEGLDADAILAAQAALIGSPGDTVTVATSNLRHLARFPGIDARDWLAISP